MAGFKAERVYDGKTPEEIYTRTRQTLDDLARRYSLQHDSDVESRTGKVGRLGTEGRYRVDGTKLSLDMTYSFLLPGSVRRKVEDEINQRLDGLFS